MTRLGTLLTPSAPGLLLPSSFIGADSGFDPTSLPGLAAYYRADKGTLDSTGTQQATGPIQTWKDQYASYDGQQTTTAAMATAGLLGGVQALSFDGSDDGYPLAAVPSSGGNFTISGWVYQSLQTSGVYYPIYAQAGCGLHLKGSQLTFHGAADYSASNGLSLNTWTHVACTYQGTTVKLFKNGVQDNNAYSVSGLTLPGSTGSIGTGQVGLGFIPGVSGYVFNGGIADVIIRTACLSAAQVLQEYQNWGPH